tara:strand:- start:93 stop:617 length:525 start_codon:yes stop_codon:yes gene_type:complete
MNKNTQDFTIKFRQNEDYNIHAMMNYLLEEISKGVAQREIQIFRMHNEATYITDQKEREWITYLNESVYGRPMMRYICLCTLEDRWASVPDIITSIGCQDKTARLALRKAMDSEMVTLKKGDKKLLYQATGLAMSIYYRYIKQLYLDPNSPLPSMFHEIMQYRKLSDKLVTTTK